MERSLEEIKERIARFKEEKPMYGEILDFYTLFLEEQGKMRAQLKIKTFDLDEEPMSSRRQRGMPLLEKEEFEIDLAAAKKLFDALCLIGRRASRKMEDEIPKIEQAARAHKLDLEDSLSRHYDEDYLAQEADRWGLDRGIFSF